MKAEFTIDIQPPTPAEMTEVAIARLLPPDARLLLRQLFMIESDIPIGRSKARTAALAQGEMQVRRTYPKHFKS